MEETIVCENFTFLNNFDSANLAQVENVNISQVITGKNSQKNSGIEQPSYEFNIWTKHDCHGTEFQNNNKTWFYFGVKSPRQGVFVKLNIVNLNRQIKMFSQGMCPVYKVIPGHPQWERIKDKPSFIADDKNNQFTISFIYRTSDNPNAITYFAFTYPFSYTDLQNYLHKIDIKMDLIKQKSVDDIYYHRECAIKSLEGRRLDILTISSHHNITKEREHRIKNLFPEENQDRPFKFKNKKIIFISARVHPGETPSSFVFNGFLQLLLNKEDQIATTLRRLYVFKLIPMLNPDGVAQGYYRMDTKGVNLNRFYLNPSIAEHPTIYAAKTLLRYYHQPYTIIHASQFEIEPDLKDTTNLSTCEDSTSNKIENIIENDVSCKSSFINSTTLSSFSKETCKLLERVTHMTLDEKHKYIEQGSRMRNCLLQQSEETLGEHKSKKRRESKSIEELEKETLKNSEESNIFLYIDFHGHASKKGIFMYGNHFDNPEDSSDCMLLPKLMSINNPNFHFTSCNFAEKNMYIIDKRDGMSREGSGRVAIYKLTGLIYSYTLECNYNTGRIVNNVPARVKERYKKIRGQVYVPPKYNPAVFEGVGAALGPSILDMTGDNPNSRIPNSQYRSLKNIKSYLKLISANHYTDSSLNKSLLKSKTGSRFQYSQESTFNEVEDRNFNNKLNSVMKSSSFAPTYSQKSSCIIFRHENKKKIIKNKISRPIIGRNVQKLTARNKNHRDKKIFIPKLILSSSRSIKKSSTSTSPAYKKKINSSIKSKLFKKSRVSKRIKIEKKVKIKVTLHSTSKVVMKKKVKKKISPMLKPNLFIKPLMRTKIQFNQYKKKSLSRARAVPRKGLSKNIDSFLKKKTQFVKSKKYKPVESVPLKKRPIL